MGSEFGFAGVVNCLATQDALWGNLLFLLGEKGKGKRGGEKKRKRDVKNAPQEPESFPNKLGNTNEQSEKLIQKHDEHPPPPFLSLTHQYQDAQSLQHTSLGQ